MHFRRHHQRRLVAQRGLESYLPAQVVAGEVVVAAGEGLEEEVLVVAWVAHYFLGGTGPADLDRTGTPFWKKIREMKCEEATKVYVLTLFAEGVINR
jgi:hypothetical protein